MSNLPYQLLDHIKDQLIAGELLVEIGSDQGSGSAAYLNNLARLAGSSFVSVDINPVYIGPGITTANMSGEAWTRDALPTLGKKVSVAVLDNFDWVSEPMKVRNGTAPVDTINLIAQYQSNGLTLNNVNSAVAHLQQVVGLLPYLSAKSVVMFGDTWFNYTLDTFEGKGAGAVYLLLGEGFQLLSASHLSSYVLLGRGVTAPGVPNLNLAALSQTHRGVVTRPDTIIYTNDA